MRVGFLGSYNVWLEERGLQFVRSNFSQFVVQLSVAMRDLASVAKERYPEVFDHYKSRQHPDASGLMGVYMHLERQFLDQLAANLPPNVVVTSFEHDGLCATTKLSADTVLTHLKDKLPLPVSIKHYPVEVLEYARDKYPDHDWVDSNLDMTIDELANSWRDCRTSLSVGRGAANMHGQAHLGDYGGHAQGGPLLRVHLQLDRGP